MKTPQEARHELYVNRTWPQRNQEHWLAVWDKHCAHMARPAYDRQGRPWGLAAPFLYQYWLYCRTKTWQAPRYVLVYEQRADGQHMLREDMTPLPTPPGVLPYLYVE
jgi:hypothetical protein